MLWAATVISQLSSWSLIWVFLYVCFVCFTLGNSQMWGEGMERTGFNAFLWHHTFTEITGMLWILLTHLKRVRNITLTMPVKWTVNFIYRHTSNTELKWFVKRKNEQKTWSNFPRRGQTLLPVDMSSCPCPSPSPHKRGERWKLGHLLHGVWGPNTGWARGTELGSSFLSCMLGWGVPQWGISGAHERCCARHPACFFLGERAWIHHLSSGLGGKKEVQTVPGEEQRPLIFSTFLWHRYRLLHPVRKTETQKSYQTACPGTLKGEAILI